MANVLEINFKGVEPAKGRRTDYVIPGTYRLEIAETSKADNRSKTGKLMPTVGFVVAGNGTEKGKRLMDQFVLEGDGDSVPFGLQRFLALLESCGANPPRKAVKLDLDNLVGKQCIAEVYDEEYNDKPRSKIGQYFPPETAAEIEEDDDDEDEDEAPPPPPKKKAKKAPEPEPEEDEEEEEDEEDEEEEPPPPPAKKSSKKAPAKKAKADDDDDEEEGDEDFKW